jgi:hypothetical protein
MVGKMANPQIRPSRTRVTSCHGCNFESWLARQHLVPSEADRILIEWRSLANGDPDQLSFRAPKAGHRWHLRPRGSDVPKQVFSKLEETSGETGDFSWLNHLTPELLEWLLDWFESLKNQPYQVIITNNSGGDVENLTVFYWRNELVGDNITKVGPLQKSMNGVPLPNTKTASFETCPCFNMASEYHVAYMVGGQQYYNYFNVDDINAQEKTLYGSVDLCADTLEIYVQ